MLQRILMLTHSITASTTQQHIKKEKIKHGTDAFIYDIYLFNSSSFLVDKNLHRVLDNFFLENLPTT